MILFSAFFHVVEKVLKNNIIIVVNVCCGEGTEREMVMRQHDIVEQMVSGLEVTVAYDVSPSLIYIR